MCVYVRVSQGVRRRRIRTIKKKYTSPGVSWVGCDDGRDQMGEGEKEGCVRVCVCHLSLLFDCEGHHIHRLLAGPGGVETTQQQARLFSVADQRAVSDGRHGCC